MARLPIDGYGVVELNNCAFRRDGRIEAQCALDEDKFSKMAPCENGMVVAVDKLNGKITIDTTGALPLALVYSTEHMYDERHKALSDFANFPGSFLPRVGYLSIGDTFTTNTLSSSVVSSFEELAEEEDYGYCVPAADGSWEQVATAPQSGLYCKIVKMYTVPSGKPGVKLQVIRV